MKIGVYSGSFNPVHTGHAIVAQYLSQTTDLDEVWLMVSPQNPLKDEGGYASFHHRMKMAEIVADNCSKVKASDFESGQPVPSYTYDTLTRLHQTYPEHSLRLVIGSDNWQMFQRWRNSDRIVAEFGVIIFPRPGYELNDMVVPKNVTIVKDCPTVDVSSSLVRNMISEGLEVDYLVPVGVGKYIRENGLYRAG